MKVGWGASETTDFKKVEPMAKQTRVVAVSNEYCFLSVRELTVLSSNRTFCAGSNGKKSFIYDDILYRYAF